MFIFGADPVIIGDPNPEATYEVIDVVPHYDEVWQKLSAPTYHLVGSIVEARYTAEPNAEAYPRLIEARLAAFAKERDIDLPEVGMLLNCSNPTWVAEAQHLMQLYTQTWEIFYNTQETEWPAIEAALPTLWWPS